METEVLLAIFVFIATDISMSAARLDIKEFVGTSEKIWTVKTTNRERMKCEVDHLKSMRALSIVFERSAFIRGRRRDLRIRGVFDTRYKRRMTLFYRGSFISTETMVYMDPDQSCAVFKIESLRDWDVIYYDLRVTNSSVTSRPRPSCPHYFDRLKGFEPSFILYTPQCQQVIRAEK
uniref:Lipocalin n=1 Tax=Rhipicephalus appendiculatus TaxID=34631 RepID=A0A131YYL9_RHIAP